MSLKLPTFCVEWNVTETLAQTVSLLCFRYKVQTAEVAGLAANIDCRHSVTTALCHWSRFYSHWNCFPDHSKQCMY